MKATPLSKFSCCSESRAAEIRSGTTESRLHEIPSRPVRWISTQPSWQRGTDCTGGTERCKNLIVSIQSCANDVAASDSVIEIPESPRGSPRLDYHALAESALKRSQDLIDNFEALNLELHDDVDHAKVLRQTSASSVDVPPCSETEGPTPRGSTVQLKLAEWAGAHAELQLKHEVDMLSCNARGAMGCGTAKPPSVSIAVQVGADSVDGVAKKSLSNISTSTRSSDGDSIFSPGVSMCSTPDLRNSKRNLSLEYGSGFGVNASLRSVDVCNKNIAQARELSLRRQPLYSSDTCPIPASSFLLSPPSANTCSSAAAGCMPSSPAAPIPVRAPIPLRQMQQRFALQTVAVTSVYMYLVPI